MSDSVSRFLFEKLDIRGAFVQLEGSWQAMQRDRAYAAPTRELLGQTTAVTTLIGSQLKTPGRLTFQIQGEGPIALLVVDCDEQLRLRGMAKTSVDEISPAPLPELVGNGRLVLTLQANTSRHPYQSLVPLEGDSVAGIFEHYLAQSEQQPTRLWLFADNERACGLFLQMLPPSHQHEQDEDAWNRVQQLAATIREDEFALPAEQLLRRLFAEEDVRLFEAHPVVYHCPRDEEKVRGALLSLGRDEVQAILDEHGEVVVRDDICNHEYRFGEEILEELFPANKRTLH